MDFLAILYKKTAITPETVMISNDKTCTSNQTWQKKHFNDEVLSLYNDIIVIFQFMANMEQSRIRTPDA